MGDSNNSPTQKNNYFKVGEYLEAVQRQQRPELILQCLLWKVFCQHNSFVAANFRTLTGS